MRENFLIVEKLGFPADAVAFLQKAWGQVCVEVSAKEKYDEALALFLAWEKPEYKEQIDAFAASSGISPYTAELLVLIGGLTEAKARFLERGLEESLFLDTMRDLKNKLLECKKIHGVWGTFTARWLRNYYFCERFALGRLQYEVIEFPEESYGGVVKGDKVLCCHIPSSGPLLRADVVESLQKARAFYPEAVKDGVLTVVCNSWLLYHKHYPLFGKGGNLQAFYRLFAITDTTWETNDDFWRIFGFFYEAEKVASAPEETSLQRAFKAYLVGGNTMGGGRGILQFDGENVLTEWTE